MTNPPEFTTLQALKRWFRTTLRNLRVDAARRPIH